MKCPVCGAEVPLGSSNCPYCGYTFPNQAPNQANQSYHASGQPNQAPAKKSNTTLIVVIVAAAVIAILAGVIIWLVGFNTATAKLSGAAQDSSRYIEQRSSPSQSHRTGREHNTSAMPASTPRHTSSPSQSYNRSDYDEEDDYDEGDPLDYESDLFNEFDYILSSRKLVASDISYLSKYQLKLLRNFIYARHGYIFKTKAMKDYFSRCSWYYPEYDNVNSMLNQYEVYNAAFIKRWE